MNIPNIDNNTQWKPPVVNESVIQNLTQAMENCETALEEFDLQSDGTDNIAACDQVEQVCESYVEHDIADQSVEAADIEELCQQFLAWYNNQTAIDSDSDWTDEQNQQDWLDEAIKNLLDKVPSQLGEISDTAFDFISKHWSSLSEAQQEGMIGVPVFIIILGAIICKAGGDIAEDNEKFFSILPRLLQAIEKTMLITVDKDQYSQERLLNAQQAQLNTIADDLIQARYTLLKGKLKKAIKKLEDLQAKYRAIPLGGLQNHCNNITNDDNVKTNVTNIIDDSAGGINSTPQQIVTNIQDVIERTVKAEVRARYLSNGDLIRTVHQLSNEITKILQQLTPLLNIEIDDPECRFAVIKKLLWNDSEFDLNELPDLRRLLFADNQEYVRLIRQAFGLLNQYREQQSEQQKQLRENLYPELHNIFSHRPQLDLQVADSDSWTYLTCWLQQANQYAQYDLSKHFIETINRKSFTTAVNSSGIAVEQPGNPQRTNEFLDDMSVRDGDNFTARSIEKLKGFLTRGKGFAPPENSRVTQLIQHLNAINEKDGSPDVAKAHEILTKLQNIWAVADLDSKEPLHVIQRLAIANGTPGERTITQKQFRQLRIPLNDFLQAIISLKQLCLRFAENPGFILHDQQKRLEKANTKLMQQLHDSLQTLQKESLPIVNAGLRVVEYQQLVEQLNQFFQNLFPDVVGDATDVPQFIENLQGKVATLPQIISSLQNVDDWLVNNIFPGFFQSQSGPQLLIFQRAIRALLRQFYFIQDVITDFELNNNSGDAIHSRLGHAMIFNDSHSRSHYLTQLLPESDEDAKLLSLSLLGKEKEKEDSANKNQFFLTRHCDRTKQLPQQMFLSVEEWDNRVVEGAENAEENWGRLGQSYFSIASISDDVVNNITNLFNVACGEGGSQFSDQLTNFLNALKQHRQLSEGHDEELGLGTIISDVGQILGMDNISTILFNFLKENHQLLQDMCRHYKAEINTVINYEGTDQQQIFTIEKFERDFIKPLEIILETFAVLPTVTFSNQQMTLFANRVSTAMEAEVELVPPPLPPR